MVVGSFLWPVLIEPAFNRFEPMPAGQLRTDLLALAERNGTPVQDVLVADASPADDGAQRLRLRLRLDPADRRLRHAARRGCPTTQIESIVAHELGHAPADDVLTGTLIGALGAAAGRGGCSAGWCRWTARCSGAPGADSAGRSAGRAAACCS